jgi:hypothetical protein
MSKNAEQPDVPSAPGELESGVAPQTAAASQELQPVDSASFLRCAGCRHAKEVDTAAGTLLCDKHNMHINAEQDEIPDDCVEHEPSS